MVTMSTIERPPAGLEYKTATLAAPAPAEPSTSADMWEGIVAVTGAPTGSGVGYAPGAIGRSLARRTPKVTHGRSWLRPVGVVEEAKELPPGHPCIPATLADGTPWPPTAGAVWAKLRFITGTGDGRTTLAAARRAGPAAWALGFQATKERKRAGLRVLDDLDLFQLWPRALVDDETGPGPEVKTAGAVFEVKAGGPPGARLSFRDRPGVPRVVSRCITPSSSGTSRLTSAELAHVSSTHRAPLSSSDVVVCAPFLLPRLHRMLNVVSVET